MDQKKAKITYIISTAIYAVLFLFGTGVIYYSNYVDTDKLTLTGQTIYWMVMMTGPLGIAYNIKSMKGSTSKTKKISLGVQIFVLVCCAFWIANIYFLYGEKPDVLSQVFIWLFTVGAVNRLIGLLTGRQK